MNKFFKISIFFLITIFSIFGIFTNKIFAATGGIDSGSNSSFLCSNQLCTTGSKILWTTSNGEAVSVSGTEITGNIWGENIGWINLNPTNSGVVNTTHGVLSGYAWGQNTGWINFKPTNGGVNIDTSTGEFSGWAWAQNFGWIKFDCASGANYCVKTDWRPTTGGSTGGGSSGGGDTNPPPPPTPTCVELGTCPPTPTCEEFGNCPPAPTCEELGNCPIPPNCEELGNCPDVTPPDNNPNDNNNNSEGDSSSNSSVPVVSSIVNFIDNINSPISNFLNNNFSPEQIVKLNSGLKIATVGSALVGGAVSLSSILFLNPLTGSELILIPFRLWSLLLTALGLKKRVKPWGTVYDAVTKQPLDPVYVSLVNLEGQEVTSAITDIDGRYGFFAEPGVYKVVPRKTNYIFPSHALANRFKDEFYQDLYFGDYMNISAGQIIANNIPMDPINFDWNEFAKNKKQLFKFYSRKELIIARISDVLFGVGFSVSAISLVVFPEEYNAVIFVLYILIFILKRTKFKLKAKGRVVDTDGTPLSFAFVRVLSAATNVEIVHKVTDKMGRYHILVPNGKYIVKIEKKNDDSTYSLVHTSEPLEVMHGTLNKVFNI
jgi:hypothetical protein